MDIISLCEKLKEDEILYGLCNMYPASGIIEGMCKGWDFIWIDAQHGQHSYESVFHCVQAARAVGVNSIVRVPGHESYILCQYADMSPSAIMVPVVNNTDEAKNIVNGLRFPPIGKRSYGGRGIIDINGRNYYKETELVVIAQIETIEALDCAYDIVSMNGIDVIFFSPDDMKLSMGLPVNKQISESVDLCRGMEKVAEAARKAGKYCGIVAPGNNDRGLAIELGYQIIVVGGDSAFIRSSSEKKLEELKNENMLGKRDSEIKRIKELMTIE